MSPWFLDPAWWPARFKTRVLTELSGLIFFKKKNNIVLVKKTKVNGLQPDFWLSRRVNPPGQPGHTGFFLPCFFFNPAQFQPRIDRIPSRPAGSGHILNLCI
jgi:hypothetical protein